MNSKFYHTLLKNTNASRAIQLEEIQSLWSGYGNIARYKLEGGRVETVVIKLVQLPNQRNHPRGWNTNISHQRKVKSYQVETIFYSDFAHQSKNAKIPRLLAYDSLDNEVMLVLEDLDASGFPKRLYSLSWKQVEICLEWLANFHASFMHTVPKGLWDIGTYWHLDTRPEELEELADISLKDNAARIDKKLNDAKFKTFVHGDAKLANFCFSEDKTKVAGVDFQYVGGGCGMKDVAYFVGSCMNEEEAEKNENKILDTYFLYLQKALGNSFIRFQELEKEWRALYPFAWTDFHRFLKGWSPGHWKINSYSEQMVKQVLKTL